MSISSFEQDCYDHGISLPKLQAQAGSATTPTATETEAGTVRQGIAIPDLIAAPTQSDFNNLLTVLRAAGVISAS